MVNAQVEELLIQSLEHERGGVDVFEAALLCAIDDDLRREWGRFLNDTLAHATALETLCTSLGVDPEKRSPGRTVVRNLGVALVEAMRTARSTGSPISAQLVACECVVFAATKDPLDWDLIGKAAGTTDGADAAALTAAYDPFEDQEDEHLYHTKGWCRELWIQFLGLHAALPLHEERLRRKREMGGAKAPPSAEAERSVL